MDDELLMDIKDFVDISIDSLGIETEVQIVPRSTILQLKAAFAGTEAFERISSRLFADVAAIDEDGVSIELALDVIERCHVVTEYLSRAEIKSVKIGADGETYVVINKKRYDSLWMKYGVSYALIDLVGTKSKFRQSVLQLMKLLPKIQNAIDRFADKHPGLAVLSFADSVIVKALWRYTKQEKSYKPETFLKDIIRLKLALEKVSSSASYVIITQGQNFFEADQRIHFNDMRNHIGMFSFGPPFASLFEIEKVIRSLSADEKRDVYLDDSFYYSLVDKSLLSSSVLKRKFSCPISNTCRELIAVDLKTRIGQ
jgi:hypothetical protein